MKKPLLQDVANLASLQEILEIDRKFFELNPELDEYVRPIFSSERSEAVLNGVIRADSVLVKKVPEGVPVRIPFTRISSLNFGKKRKKSHGFGVAQA